MNLSDADRGVVGRTTGVTVLFAGQYWPGANSMYIARAFEACGAVVRILNETGIHPADWWSLGGRLARRALKPLIEYEWNTQMRELARQMKPDLIYLTNASFAGKRSLEYFNSLGIPVVCFFHDVRWDRPGDKFIEHVRHFDLISTTRAWQEPLIREAGGRAVKVVRFGYDPTAHRPLRADDRAVARYGGEIVFVGTAETARRAMLEALVGEDFNRDLKIWGYYWDRLPVSSPVRRYWQGRPVFEQEIPVVYATNKVALHWVGWEPDGTDPMMRRGDGHNSRTFQIPACGGALMLAQRTEEHARFFREDEEAVFFGNVGELKEKLAYWLDPAHEERRREIVRAGRERCVREDYTYVPVVRSYLDHFGLPATSEGCGRGGRL